MAMTWEELKENIIDLGFEEDSIADPDEYLRIIVNATNRALDVIRYTVVIHIEDYYRINKLWGEKDEDTGEWVFPTHEHVTSDTEDTYEIVLPDNLLVLLPLLTSHYVWLDDDITKATMYWNEYDQLKDLLIAACKQPKRAVIEGGW